MNDANFRTSIHREYKMIKLSTTLLFFQVLVIRGLLTEYNPEKQICLWF